MPKIGQQVTYTAEVNGDYIDPKDKTRRTLEVFTHEPTQGMYLGWTQMCEGYSEVETDYDEYSGQTYIIKGFTTSKRVKVHVVQPNTDTGKWIKPVRVPLNHLQEMTP